MYVCVEGRKSPNLCEVKNCTHRLFIMQPDKRACSGFQTKLALVNEWVSLEEANIPGFGFRRRHSFIMFFSSVDLERKRGINSYTPGRCLRSLSRGMNQMRASVRCYLNGCCCCCCCCSQAPSSALALSKPKRPNIGTLFCNGRE